MVGTAKNTGKTTALVSLLQIAARKNAAVGLTSIGYDGEDLDNLTGLPKPRVFCPAGVLVATASRCLGAGEAVIDDLCPSGRATPLGEVFIGRVVRPGTVVLAGPNETGGLSQVLESFGAAGVDLALVDGAFGRMAPASAADAVVLATGAAKTSNLRALVEETRAIEEVFDVPALLPTTAGDCHTLSKSAEPRRASRAPAAGEEDISGRPEAVRCEADISFGLPSPAGGHPDGGVSSDRSGRSAVVEGMMLVPEHALSLAGMIGDSTRRVYVRGAVDPRALQLFAEVLGGITRPLEVVFSDAIKLLVSGKPREMALALRRLEERGARPCYLKEIPLCAVTINPFYPRRVNGAYEPEALDADMMKASFASVLSRPVFDVLRDGAEVLLGAVLETRFKESASRVGKGRSRKSP